MPSVLGHGRYARWVYPQSPGAAGGGQAVVAPLSRQRFIDGDTTQLGLDGSVANPFQTIAQFMTSRTNASTPDATANYVGWVMPALAGYVENVSFPPYVSTELRADSVSFTAGTFITGNVTWNNTGPQPNAAAVSVVSMHNISVSGTFTVTDDAGAPPSIVLFGGDEVGEEGVQIQGLFDSSGATNNLQTAIFTNALLAGGITTATGLTIVVLADSICFGSITAKILEAQDSEFSTTSITCSSFAEFLGSQWQTATVLDCPNTVFDSTSWHSFLGAGGTRAVGTVVLVEGGYSGAGVEGANLLSDGSTTGVSLNGTGASVGYSGEHSGNHYQIVGLSMAGGAVVLQTGGGEKPGDTILITKPDFAAQAYAVKNNAAVTIATIPTLAQGFVLARFNGSDWVFEEGGSLLA